jgi:sulfonate transport system ATP-binding protein
LENVGIGQQGDWRGRAVTALRSVGLEQRPRDWPAVLSGGQRQRVSLARALMAEPRLLLLDEPLGALDALTRLDMQALIEHVWQTQGFTALLVTHDVAEAVTLADRVVLIDKGRITLNQKIDLPRPRRRGSAELAKIEGLILSHILGTAEPAWF